MVANRRADYQRLCEELKGSESKELRSKLQEELRELIAEDEDYARGFIEDSLRRALRYLSPTVGRNDPRPFSLAVEISHNTGVPTVLLGASFLPRVGDDVEQLTNYFGEELYGLARLKGFDWLIEELAVNGLSIDRNPATL